MNTKSNKTRSTAKKPSVIAQEGAGATRGAYNEDSANEWSRDIWLMTRPELEQHFNAITDCDERAAHALAVYVVKFMDALAEGSQGVMKAANSLRDSAELLYLQSNSHHVAFELFLESIRDPLRSQNESMMKFKAGVSKGLRLSLDSDQKTPEPPEQTARERKDKPPAISKIKAGAKREATTEGRP